MNLAILLMSIVLANINSTFSLAIKNISTNLIYLTIYQSRHSTNSSIFKSLAIKNNNTRNILHLSHILCSTTGYTVPSPRQDATTFYVESITVSGGAISYINSQKIQVVCTSIIEHIISQSSHHHRRVQYVET